MAASDVQIQLICILLWAAPSPFLFLQHLGSPSTFLLDHTQRHSLMTQYALRNCALHACITVLCHYPQHCCACCTAVDAAQLAHGQHLVLLMLTGKLQRATGPSVPGQPAQQLAQLHPACTAQCCRQGGQWYSRGCWGSCCTKPKINRRLWPAHLLQSALCMLLHRLRSHTCASLFLLAALQLEVAYTCTLIGITK